MAARVNVTDETILAFAAEHACTNVVITRPKDRRGKHGIYISYTCACGKPAGTLWKRFKVHPMCKSCSFSTDRGNDDNSIREMLHASGLEFISCERRFLNGKVKAFVKFICTCDKDTSRVVNEMAVEHLKYDKSKCTRCVRDRIRSGLIKAFSERLDEINSKRIATNRSKYGVDNVIQNPEIALKASKNNYLQKDYKFPSGRVVSCQGYEPLAYELLLSKGVDEEDIYVEKDITDSAAFPTFKYEYEGKARRYLPDIYIASEDKIIEVKSDYTFEIQRERNILKALSVKKYGYAVEIWIFNKYNKLIQTLTF